MFFEPPRHGKSERVSRLFSAYFLYRHPEKWVGLNSYAAELAYTLSRAARENYEAMGGQVKDSAAAVKHWETGQGGGMWAAGVGGPITGKGFHLGIIDDPLKNAEEANSETIREKHKEWYGSTFLTREEPWAEGDPDSAIIIIQTRWNEDDLSGWLLQQEESEDDPEDAERWHIVNFEAVKDGDDEKQEFPETCTVEPDPRKPGEALCPERRPLEKLNRIRKRIGEYFWSALFQQRPAPLEGNILKRKWFYSVAATPEGLRWCRYWDLATSEEEYGDYTACVKMAIEPVTGAIWIADGLNVKLEWPEVHELIIATAERDGREVFQAFEQKGFQKAVIQNLQKDRRLAGYPLIASNLQGDKVVRAYGWAARAGLCGVYLQQASWNEPFIAQCCTFPNAGHDDWEDAAAGAFITLFSVAPTTKQTQTDLILPYSQEWHKRMGEAIYGKQKKPRRAS